MQYHCKWISFPAVLRLSWCLVGSIWSLVFQKYAISFHSFNFQFPMTSSLSSILWALETGIHNSALWLVVVFCSGPYSKRRFLDEEHRLLLSVDIRTDVCKLSRRIMLFYSWMPSMIACHLYVLFSTFYHISYLVHSCV